MKKLLLYTLVCAAILLPCGAQAANEHFTTLLQRFEKTTQAREANRFFALLHAEEFTDSLISFGTATPADTLRAQVWYWAAEYLYDRQDYKQAAYYGEKALPLLRGKGGEADCLNLLAVVFIRLTDYPSAAKYAKLCYALDEKSGDPDMMSSSLNTLTAIYMSANQPKEAEKYLLKGLAAAEKAGNPARKAVLLGMASEVYHAMGDDKKALPYAQQSYEQEKQLGHDDKAVLRQSQMASALIGLHYYQQAEKVLDEAIPILREMGDIHSLAIAANKMGMALLCQKREAEAVGYYREAAQILQKMGDMANEMHARRGLYESLWKSNPDSAKMELGRFNDLKDSLYNNASAESLARYNAEFENDWLQKENEEERSARRGTLVASIAIVVVLLCLAIAIWWVMWRRHKRQEAVNQQLTANIDELRKRYSKLATESSPTTEGQHGQDPSETLSEADREFIDRTINAINTLMLRGQVDADSLASEMGMSLYQLRQRLISVTGEKPQNYITTQRMNRAKHLLDNNPELNVTEIAVLCAYSDTSNFTRAFKKYFGKTPTQYLNEKPQA